MVVMLLPIYPVICAVRSCDQNLPNARYALWRKRVRIWKVVWARARKWSTSRIGWRHVERASLNERKIHSESQGDFMVRAESVMEQPESCELVSAILGRKEWCSVRPEHWIERVRLVGSVLHPHPERRHAGSGAVISKYGPQEYPHWRNPLFIASVHLLGSHRLRYGKGGG